MIFKKILNLNFLLIFIILILITIGTAALYSAGDGSFSPWAKKHIIRFGVLFFLMIIIALIDIKFIFKYSYLLFFLCLLLLFSVEIIGTFGKGAERWIRIFGISVQPSEIIKVAIILAQEGFSCIEEIAYVPENEMLGIEEFDNELVNALRERAKDIMLTTAIAKEEKLGDATPADDLLNMEGMERPLAYELASMGIITMEDLAEQSVDELLVISGMDKDRAGELIMTARIPWFENEETVSESPD